MSADKSSRFSRRYDRAARFYEKVAHVYSTGQIRASKRFQLSQMEAGDKVLFVGAGAGEDAVLAARHGAEITCVDISEKMLQRVADRFDAAGLRVELVCQNAFEFDRFDAYDAVAANYFLNVFRREPMKKMLHHTARLVRPGGKYLLADVSLPMGNPLSKAFNLLYLKSAMAGACAMGLTPWHENYDYCAFFPEAGLEVEQVKYFRFAKIGPILFQSIVGIRQPAS